MKNFITITLLLMVCFGFLSCRKNIEHDKKSLTKNALSELKVASEKQKENPDLEARLAFWRKQLTNPKFNTDSVLLSKLHYNIAGVFYSMDELDSIKKHMQIAWQLMENQVKYEDEKVLLYSGLGNVANLEQKLHQANYYYNKASQMLLVDSTIKLNPKQKISVYFAAAQSSAQLRQFDNAFTMNRKAIELVPKLAENFNETFRAYSQMASCFYRSDGHLDSTYHYIKKMEELYAEKPTISEERFIFDRKASYFAKKQIKDSVLAYSRKRLVIDVLDVNENGQLANSIITGDLYTSYTDMAGIMVNFKELDSAKTYFNLAEKFIKEHPNKVDDENLMLYEQNKISYLFATKNFVEAKLLQDVLLKRVKSVYERENSRAIAEMGALFQLEAKDKSIHNLSETVVLSQTKLQRNRLWLAVSTLTFLLAISVAFLLYFFQRQKKLKTESEKVQLEQQLLRTQMEPHFIFNTLSALQSFIRFNENDKALKYLHQFGRLLRSSLQLSRESSVKLSEEIEALENYLSLQKMRYDDAFNYQINIDEEHETESMYVPPMLMQPFVENAILHGINPNGKNGSITIDFDVKNEILIVKIKDNGNGISTVVKSSSHQSLATKISRERLAYIAKESGLNAGIDIKNSEMNGTLVTISIPIKSGKCTNKKRLYFNK